MDASGRPVTHVFTDIEGSTRLWEMEPDRMARALAQHDALARRVVARHAGRLVKSTGDGWHAVFEDPADALRAACDFEIDLGDVGRSAGLPLSVRCGVHTGVAQARDGDFYGSSVNRTARIMAAAHGGQVLVSEAAARLVADRLPEGFALKELGRVRLRDLAGAECVYQLAHAALQDAFPPLRGLDATPNNLPSLASTFVGRTGTLAELAEALARHRLVTITGPGGIGKTRVAIQLAADVLDRFDDGAWLVELAPVADPTSVTATLAAALGVTEKPDEPLIVSVNKFLAERRALVVLDNCEHALDAIAPLADALLRGTSRTKLLATSREPLRIEGEYLYALPALALPANDAALGADNALRSPAIALFATRAHDQAPGFVLNDGNAPIVARICRTLDGMPLAIELAAARVRSLALDDIERRLDDRFRLLTGGLRADLPHHRTLESLVAWSHNLLDQRERALFDRCGVFVGSFDLDAAEAVGAAPPIEPAEVVDLVASLVDKSLIVADGSGDRRTVRYRMLETLRAFALRELVNQRAIDAAKQRHAAHYARLLRGIPGETEGDARGAYLACLETEIDNLRAALAFGLAEPGTGEAAGELAVAFADFCELRGRYIEAGRAVEAALARLDASAPSLLKARLGKAASHNAALRGRFAEARTHGETALAEFRRSGRPSEVAAVLERLAQIAGWQGDYETSNRMLIESREIYIAEGDRLSEAKTLVNLATTCSLACRYEDAWTYAEQAVAAGRAIGALNVEGYAENALAAVLIQTDRPVEAREYCNRAVAIAQRIGDRLLEAVARGDLAQVELAAGNVDASHPLSREVLEFFVASELHRETSFALDDIAHALALRGELGVAAQLFAAADRIRLEFGIPLAASERVRMDARIAEVREKIGAPDFDAAWSTGGALRLEDALRLARETPLPTASSVPSTTTRPARSR